MKLESFRSIFLERIQFGGRGYGFQVKRRSWRKKFSLEADLKSDESLPSIATTECILAFFAHILNHSRLATRHFMILGGQLHACVVLILFNSKS